MHALSSATALPIAGALSLCAVLSAALPAFAQTPYPAKPIRIIVPFAPGGPNDVLARLIGSRLTEAWSQPVIIDNRGGAGGTIGAEAGARAPADGYTLTMGGSSNMTVAPALYAKLSYNPLKDFTPIANVARVPYLLVINPRVPAKTVKELVAIARAKPGMLNYSSAGPGSSQHLAAALLNTLMKIETTHVPYRGSPPALAGVVAGEIAYMVPTLTTALPQIQNGRVRAIAVTGPTREQEVPNIPTVAETIPGYDVVSWWGVVAPANTPRPAVDRLNADLVRTLAATDVKTGLLKVGMNASSTTPDQFAQYIRDEIAKWTKVAKAANIKLE